MVESQFVVPVGTSDEIEAMKDGLEMQQRWQRDLIDQDAKTRREQVPARKLLTGVQMADQAEQEFGKAANKPEAMAKLGPQFEAAITQSDKDGAATVTRVAGTLHGMRYDRDHAAGTEQYAASQKMLAFSQITDPADKAYVKERLSAYENGVSDRFKEGVVQELGKRFPRLAAAIKFEEKATTAAAPIHAREKQLLAKAESTVHERMQTRHAFADALAQVGETQRAQALRTEAMNIFLGMVASQARAENEARTQSQMPEGKPKPREIPI